jgi:hypothetical protein
MLNISIINLNSKSRKYQYNRKYLSNNILYIYYNIILHNQKNTQEKSVSLLHFFLYYDIIVLVEK